MKKLYMFAALALIGALTLSAAPSNAEAAKFRLCTGNKELNYAKAGHYLKQRAQNVDVVYTKGSIDNLDKIVAGECDGGFVQSDALMVYSQRNAKAISTLERAGILYQEQVHMICNRKYDLGRMVNLKKDMTVAVGADGSGGNTTWSGFVMADKDRYGKISTSPLSGDRMLSAVADGSLVQCGLIVTALNAPFIKNEVQKAGSTVILVGTDDRDMTKTAKDARGQAVYTYGEIPADTYPAIQPSGTVYGTKSVGTVQVDAVFVANVDWINANEDDYNKILRGFNAAKPDILKLAKPQ